MSTVNKQLAETAELPGLDRPSRPSAGVGRVRVDCAGLTNTGLVRSNNEDHFFVARFGRFLEPLITNMGQASTMFEEEGHGLVVADGMGGAAAGELASNLAIRTLLQLVIQTPDWIFAAAGAEAERVMARMTERFRVIDDVLLEKAAKDAQLRGMGTTMTLACNVGDMLVLTHIGDSRAYLFRAGTLHQLTHDHTVAQALVDQGYLIHVSEAATHLQHTLVKVLGGTGKQDADVQRLTLLDQDVMLLCSDGLTDMVEDADIARILAKSGTAAELCKALVERALANGGKDNVTVVVARYAFVDRPK